MTARSVLRAGRLARTSEDRSDSPPGRSLTGELDELAERSAVHERELALACARTFPGVDVVPIVVHLPQRLHELIESAVRRIDDDAITSLHEIVARPRGDTG